MDELKWQPLRSTTVTSLGQTREYLLRLYKLLDCTNITVNNFPFMNYFKLQYSLTLTQDIGNQAC